MISPQSATPRTADAPELRLVFWELTARCNLCCRHCRGQASATPARGELSTAELQAVARDIRAAGDPLLILTGGEPLARPDFFAVAAESVRLFSRVALASNGTLIDGEMARRIAAAGIRRVSISLDGAAPDTHDRFRGQPGSFAAALRGYDALARAGMSMQINATVTRHNDAELGRLLQLALDRGADAFHLFMLVPVGCGAEIGAAERLSPRRFEDVLRWLFECTLELGDRIQIKATCAPQYHRIMQEISRARGLGPPRAAHGLHAVTRGCLAGSAVCFVSCRGDVQPCGYLPLAAGNVREARFANLWRDAPLFQALRDPRRLNGACGACACRGICGGCRARAYAATGDVLQADPSCLHVPAARTETVTAAQAGDNQP
jgi:radical SAM protein with 4Fe4S-binding SPASM domain